MSQNLSILNYLQSGKTLTGLDALKIFGTMKLASRISELRAEGHNIADETIHDQATGKHYKKYWMGEPPKDEYSEAVSQNNLAAETQINRKAFEKDGQFAFLPA